MTLRMCTKRRAEELGNNQKGELGRVTGPISDIWPLSYTLVVLKSFSAMTNR